MTSGHSTSVWSASFCLFTRFTVCLILPIRKLSSRLDSVSDVSRSGMTMLESISPMCCILDCCDLPSVAPCKACNSRLSWRTEANVSMIARVACVACGLFRIVASIYNPFSVNALGRTRVLGDRFAVKIFDRKSVNSCLSSSSTYPLGNFSGLLRTA